MCDGGGEVLRCADEEEGWGGYRITDRLNRMTRIRA